MIKNLKIFVICLVLVLLAQSINCWCWKTQFSDAGKINSIDFSRDGSKIVTASDTNRVIVWDAHTLQQLFIYNFPAKALTAKFSKDNSMIAIGGQIDNIHVLKVSDYSVITSSRASNQNGKVFEVDFSEDTSRLLSCGNSDKAHLYSISGTNFSNPADSQYRGAPISCCRILSNTSTTAYGDKQGDAYLNSYNNAGWLTFGGAGGSLRYTPKVSGTERRAVDWNIISKQAYFGGTDKILQIIHTSGNVDRWITIGKQIYTISVARDSTYAAIGGQDGLMYLYNVVTKNSQTLQYTLNESAPNHLYASAFSPDGQYLVTGDGSGMMNMYKRVCSGCPSGSYANASDCRSCNTDIPGCYLCKNATWCFACSNGYYLDLTIATTRLCQPCISKITGCNQCSSNTTCISCIQGFYLDTAANPNICKTCWSVSKGCLMCNDSSTCQQCDFRYFLSPSNTCVTCSNITNCLSCNSSTFCMQCVQGYYEDGAGGCTQCTKNCTYCINGTFCSQCDNSFYLKATGECALCTVAGCLSCNSSNYCFDCMQTMFETATGGCSFCTPPCLECTTSATTCQACIVGYYLSTTSCLSCTTITEGCVGCKGGAATDCTACATGYYLTAAGSCSQCKNLVSNCAQCNSTTCSVCRLGFYYDSTAPASCKMCSPGCLTCVDSTICLSCQVGYYYTQSANNCTLCPSQCAACQSSTVCTSCNPMYYYNSTNKNCTKCSVTNCVSCKDSTTCLTCSQGFYIDSAGTLCKECKLGIPRCMDCYNSSYCKACQLGFYLIATNASCSQCVSPCSTCDVGGCITCQLGHFLNTLTPKSCSACPKECSECVSTGNCSKCVPGYYHDSTTDACLTCQNIKPGCSACNSTQCFSCKLQIGYFLNVTDFSCPLCSSKIPNCLNCLSDTNCILCQYGYTLTSTNTTCTICSSLHPNCENCLNTSKCQNCMKGYYLDTNGACVQCVQGCSSCNNTATCEICLREYVLETNFACSLCENKIMGCQMCKYNPTIQCTNCVTGYFLTSTTCTLCSSTMSGCSICSDGSTCLTCSSGYYHDPSNKCFLCSSVRTNCQLCKYNSGTSSVDCLDCNEGYFLSGTSTCDACIDTACLSCSDSTTCTRCQTGFYLSAGDCLKCQNTFSGCRLCNSSQCLQCGSGFYLDGSNQCQPCSIQGCQLCSQLNPTTKCLSCNSQYYLTVGQTCQLCKVPLPNCLQCANSLTCQQCDSGYYLSPLNKCDLCSNKFVGCSLCSPSVCLECGSGYLLDSATDTCELCNKYIPGCSFCLSESTCLSCQSGYYADNNKCFRCSTIKGCLECTNSTQCIFCDYGYFLQNDTCHLCNTTIQNCIACASPVMCTACLGNYILAAGACAELKGESFPNYTDIKLITEYVSQNQLKHTLQSIGKKIIQIDLNWTQESKLFILDQNYTEHQLKIKRVEFSPSGYSLVFYTDNPLGNMTDLNSLKNMPLLSQSKYTTKRLLENQHLIEKQQNQMSPHIRLLSGFSMNNRFKTKIEMSEQGINSLFPNIHHSGNFYMKYKLSQPEFYRSVVNQQTYYYIYFGYIVSVTLVILYFVKSVFIAPDADDKGEIIPHILCYKMMAFIIYPLYGEYLNYCQGFLLLDLPWLNHLLSPLLTIDSDTSPQTYKIFYNNLNLPSTYLLALIVEIVIFGIGFGVLKYVLKNQKLWNSFRGYLYNLFICGIVVGSFLSLQGAYYNPVSSISVNSIFYILGISIFVAVLIQSMYSIYKSVSETIIPFHKPRIIIKCMALSLAYANPLYIFMSLVFLDLCLIIIEYILKKDKKVSPKLWLFNNILADIGLSLMMLGPYSLISVFIASACIIAVIGIDIFIMIKENGEMRELQKVKLQQNQLIKTMAAIEKQHLSARSKNHQIYFKNKILQDLQAQNNLDDRKHDSTNYFSAFNQSQSLFYEQNQQKSPKPGFQTIPIYEESSENLQDHEEIKRPEPVPSRRKASKSPLRNRRKPEKKDWSLQQENPGTFVLG